MILAIHNSNLWSLLIEDNLRQIFVPLFLVVVVVRDSVFYVCHSSREFLFGTLEFPNDGGEKPIH